MGLVTFLKGRWSWVKQKPLVWLNLALILLTAYFTAHPGPVLTSGPSDFRIRAWAVLLQLLGAWTVWYDLTTSARAFGKGSLLGHFWSWLKAGLGRHHMVIGCATGHLGLVGGRARATQRRNVNKEAPLDERIEALEFNLQRIDNDLSGALREIDTLEANQKQKIIEERQAREAALRALEERLKESIVGNYASLAFGAFWVMVGIVLSTFSPEIAKAAAGQWAELWRVM